MDCNEAIGIAAAIWAQTEDRLRSAQPGEILAAGRRMAGVRRILMRVEAATLYGGRDEQWLRRRLRAAARAMVKEYACWARWPDGPGRAGDDEIGAEEDER